MTKLVKIPFSIYGPMKSGQGELEERTYKKIKGSKGTWYVAAQENAGDNVYFAEANPDPKAYFQGFGGATLTFRLEDGTEDQVKGPWHSNSGALFNDTGYDVRDKYFTRGIIAKNREYSVNMRDGDIYTDVLHYDEEPVLGEFDRIEKMAQNFANEHNCQVYYAMKSSGGGSSAVKQPENK